MVTARRRLDRLRKTKTPPGSPLNAQLRGKRPKSPSRWAPVETVLQRPSCTRHSAKGRDGWLGRGCWARAPRDDRSGRALLEHRRAGRDRRNETKRRVGYLLLSYLRTQECSIYCGARGDHMVCTKAERSCVRLREDLEHNHPMHRNCAVGVGMSARRRCLLSTSIPM